MNTLAERLKYAMEVLPSKKVKGVDLARFVGVRPPSVSDWLSGKSKTMEGENLLKTAKFLNVDPVWLANGTGKPVKEDKEKNLFDSSSELNIIATINKDIRQILDDLIYLDKNNKLSNELINAIKATINIVKKHND